MVARSKCELERLTLSNLLISPLDIQETLVSLPTLKSLTYHECGDTSTTRFLLNLLMPKPASPKVLPALRELGIALETAARVDEETIMVNLAIEMVKSRQMEGLPALALTIRVCQPLQAVNREALRGVNADSIEKSFFASC
ncbi:hypothetical protein Moror_4255 [Moniliophthora roreri MCA 2997]|uniref:Uncharacterized protein n=2 Tax=Moniliophthora roreri TaxID=221103 RepID=V2XCM6_MONRO|nr:hypothetical protein Moror_4255 [Moniliophthora roreri MCA 2997]